MKTSELWENLANEKFAKIDAHFLATFRESGNANNRLAAWDPFDQSMRYYKFLFFNEIQKKDDAYFASYLKIGETSLGNPVTLPGPNGEKINLDHFFSVEEYFFLRENIKLDDIQNVIEIGAGFGRTAQAIIRLVRNITTYTIVDIPQVLALSACYLEKVLSLDEFAKLDFVNAFEIDENFLNSLAVDLVINIDSFQEMPKETVRFYLENVVSKSKYFYSKNPVGKYSPESVGIYGIEPSRLLDVFSLGLSTDLIDIFDKSELVKAREKHVYMYRPSDRFSVIAQAPLGIFPYYQNVLYKNLD
jgi:putative sugar O-methyltransferase